MAAIVNLTINQGSTWTQTLEWQDGDGAAIEVVGMTAEMQIRRKYADADGTADPLVTLTDTAGITLAAGGVITMTLTATATEAIRRGTYLYDLELTDSGVVTRVCEGTITVRPEVTR